MSSVQREYRDQWSANLQGVGTDLASRLERKAVAWSLRERTMRGFHIVSTVEDFSTIGRAVREALSPSIEVTYSCLWTQYEILNDEPLIESCPVFRAFHDEEPSSPYSLVPVLSNVGSVAPLRAMIVHLAMEERFTRFRSIEVLCADAFVEAPAALERELPTYLRTLVSWSDFKPDPAIGPRGYGSNLGERTPAELVGLGDPIDREHYTPPELQRRIEQRPRRRRPPPSPNQGHKTPVF